MEQWLLRRLFAQADQPTPRFAYQGTINWMRALSILCDSSLFAPDELRKHYTSVQRRKVNEEADTWAFENIFMSLHNLSALRELVEKCEPVPVVRSAIIGWYYAVYYAASGMVAAASGSKQETHAETAKVWHADIVSKNLAIGPLGLRLDTMVDRDVKEEISRLRNGNDFALANTPNTEAEAWGGCLAYLSGTAGYEREKIEMSVKSSREFKELDVENFRTRSAAKLRDARLEGKPVNFLIQAFRYRGKANYRDSIYLSYGSNRESTLKLFVEDLENVAANFIKMSCAYIARRVEKGTWDLFVQDLEENSQIHINRDVVQV